MEYMGTWKNSLAVKQKSLSFFKAMFSVGC